MKELFGQENHKIFTSGERDFEALALEVFQYQLKNNAVYGAYVKALGTDTSRVDSLARIPFLPVRFFKNKEIKTGDFEPAAVFESSGTTGMVNSRHFVKDLTLYRESFTRGFELFMVRLSIIVFLVSCPPTWKEGILPWCIWWMN